MRSAALALVSAWIGSVALQAQDHVVRLQVQPDPENVVANSILGVWRSDAPLNQRLGGAVGAQRLEFRSDASVLAKVPAKIATKLEDLRIFLAGTMVMGTAEHAFLVTSLRGNPTVVWFRPRGNDPMGDAESWNVMLARAEVAQADMLFVGGDSNNQSFRAFVRDGKPAGKLEPAAALTEMIRLVQAGRTREFVEQWVLPVDLQMLEKQGRSIESLMSRFEGERGAKFVEMLEQAGKSAPTLSEDGNQATWPIEGRSSGLRLRRIDGRWYLENR